MSNKTLLTVSLPENRQVADEYDKIVVKMYLQHQHNMQKCKERQQDNDVICEQNCSTFLICGTDPSVGTSSVALHLAVGLAKSGKHVLLLDIDMRSNRQKKLVGKDCEHTLANYLMDECALDEAIVETTIEHMDFISGGIAVDPVQLLCSARMKGFFEIIKKEYDMILMDVPSMGASADATAVMKYSDQIILVAAPYKTYKKQLIESYETFQKYGGNLLGVVVNCVDRYGYKDYMRNAGYYTEHQKETLLGKIKRKLEKKQQQEKPKEKKTEERKVEKKKENKKGQKK